jgi:serine/threonine protein phosphatase 1
MTARNSRLYVIGDIHGRLDLLDHMIEMIDLDVQEYGGDNLIVTLGDYIDRGPDSRGVLDRLLNNPFPGRYVALRGNHETLLESFLKTPALFGPNWSRLGGLETIKSFGITVKSRMNARHFDHAAAQLRATLSSKQSEFLDSLKMSLTVGRYFLCHAGVRPGITLELQSDDDLLWIRDEFLNSQLDFGKIVIHGHTPTEKPEVLTNRINIDTGAFVTGRLTCVVLEEEKHRFIST